MKKGFTLVELIVTIGVMLTILTVVVLSRSDYTDSINLNNLADDVSLRFFEAQAYGIGVREFGPGSEEFSVSYGLSFSINPDSNRTSFISFADRNGNVKYDNGWGCPTGAGFECISKTRIEGGNSVEDICAVLSDSSNSCGGPRKVDISFTRPRTEANIVFYNASGNEISPGGAIGARIIFKSPKEVQVSVIVYNNGQISIE